MLHITIGSGKMDGIVSINTSSLQNDFCQSMHDCRDNVCNSCYAIRLTKFRSTLENKLEKNSELLSEAPLADDQIPAKIGTAKLVRFNSFGELINTQHYRNLIKIVENSVYNIRFSLRKMSLFIIKPPPLVGLG